MWVRQVFFWAIFDANNLLNELQVAARSWSVEWFMRLRRRNLHKKHKVLKKLLSGCKQAIQLSNSLSQIILLIGWLGWGHRNPLNVQLSNFTWFVGFAFA